MLPGLSGVDVRVGMLAVNSGQKGYRLFPSSVKYSAKLCALPLVKVLSVALNKRRSDFE